MACKGNKARGNTTRQEILKLVVPQDQNQIQDFVMRWNVKLAIVNFLGMAIYLIYS